MLTEKRRSQPSRPKELPKIRIRTKEKQREKLDFWPPNKRKMKKTRMERRKRVKSQS